MASKSRRLDRKHEWPSVFADAVRIRRKQLQLTQVQVAALAGCGPDFIYDVENGKPTLRLDKVVGVLVVLGLQLTLETGQAGFQVKS